MKQLKVYVASSWRNPIQPEIVKLLKGDGRGALDVYDFRNPAPGDKGFGWSSIDPNWQNWTPREFRLALSHPTAQHGFHNDMTAVKSADLCVLVLPCGRSAHLEAGYIVGAGKPCIVYAPTPWPEGRSPKFEPELMYLMCGAGGGLVVSLGELMDQIWQHVRAFDDGNKLAAELTRGVRSPAEVLASALTPPLAPLGLSCRFADNGNGFCEHCGNAPGAALHRAPIAHTTADER